MKQYVNAISTSLLSSIEGCLECRAKLLIYPDQMHPSEVTKMLGIEPTRENIAGTTKTNSYGRTRQIKISGWFLISEHEVNSLDLGDHVDWLLGKIGPIMDRVLALQSIDGVTMRLDFVWWGDLGRGGPILRPDQLRTLAKLGLECPLSACYYGDAR